LFCVVSDELRVVFVVYNNMEKYLSSRRLQFGNTSTDTGCTVDTDNVSVSGTECTGRWTVQTKVISVSVGASHDSRKNLTDPIVFTLEHISASTFLKAGLHFHTNEGITALSYSHDKATYG
jgi:hypothetical protein